MKISGKLLQKNIFSKIADDFTFAGAVALTRVAKIGQTAVKKTIEQTMTLRNVWTLRGIRITPATKINLKAEIYSLDWYLPDHDAGGTRGAHWIPGDQFATRTGIDPKSKIIPKAFRLPKILEKQFVVNPVLPKSKKKNLPFVAKTKKGMPIVAVKSITPGRQIDILYMQIQKSKIAKRDIFQPVVDKAYNENLQKEYDKAVSEYVLQ